MIKEHPPSHSRGATGEEYAPRPLGVHEIYLSDIINRLLLPLTAVAASSAAGGTFAILSCCPVHIWVLYFPSLGNPTLLLPQYCQ